MLGRDLAAQHDAAGGPRILQILGTPDSLQMCHRRQFIAADVSL